MHDVAQLARSLQDAAAMPRCTFVSLSVATLVASVTGCATDRETTSPGAGGGGKADGAEAVIAFSDDWSETVSGDLVAGSPVLVDYDLDRLQTCRGSTGGSEVWGVTGYASFDGGEPVTLELSRLDGGTIRPVRAELDIPAGAASVAMWFSISNRWGCIAYDSNLNANYTFAVTSPGAGPTISFDADWSESQTGALVAGEPAVIHYDPERLSQCAASSGGMATWSVTMHYRVDGGSEHTLGVTRADGPVLVPSDPRLTIPGGRELETWFSATSTYGCHAYDSDFGANYHFAIE